MEVFNLAAVDPRWCYEHWKISLFLHFLIWIFFTVYRHLPKTSHYSSYLNGFISVILVLLLSRRWRILLKPGNWFPRNRWYREEMRGNPEGGRTKREWKRWIYPFPFSLLSLFRDLIILSFGRLLLYLGLRRKSFGVFLKSAISCPMVPNLSQFS